MDIDVSVTAFNRFRFERISITLFVKDLSLFVTEEYNDDINSIADSVGVWGLKLY